MAKNDPKQPLMPSIIDRLTDPLSGGTAAQPGYTLKQMMDSVRRDLEDLLNTRQSDMATADDFPEVHRSVIGFGLPDLTSLNAITPSQRANIGQTVSAVIRMFEPRLREVRAILINTGEAGERRVEFLIEGKLTVDPAPEVAFDTILELATGHYSIKSGGK